MNLVPYPRSLRKTAGFFKLPASIALHFDRIDLAAAGRLQTAIESTGCRVTITTGSTNDRNIAIHCRRGPLNGFSPYHLSIRKSEITLLYDRADDPTNDGLRAGIATLRQLFREYGRRLPCLEIGDSADFARRGVMLDISRGRVPRLETLLELVDHLADLKINEIQLYIEHTFAYSKYKPVWRDWGALTGKEIRKLSARCSDLGIDLVPNQNSFGHLRSWLEYKPLKKLAEIQEPWTLPWGQRVRWPFSLAPRHPGTLRFLRGLYNELLPHFQSQFFNVGCDETWDLCLGQSRLACERLGKGTVYLNFLCQIHKEVIARGKQMMFWGDIILQYPDLLHRLPRKNIIAMNWGYEATHPFAREAPLFAAAGIPFYVCPGTSSWLTLIGRHDNALENLKNAARVGLKHGARGYLITDWGDAGHPQPLAVSYVPIAIGAGLSWCAKGFRLKCVVPALNRDVFMDSAGKTGRAAFELGMAHQTLRYHAFNCTPLGEALTAPPPSMGEMWCKDGLKYYARIEPKALEATLQAIEKHRKLLCQGRPKTPGAKMLAAELDIAARMAAESCRYMLWQQWLARSEFGVADRIAARSVKALQALRHDFGQYWPLRNKATPVKCYQFLNWRINDYRKRILHYPPGQARENAKA